MASKKGGTKQPFNKAVQLQTNEPVKSEASETVTQEQPIPRPKPPAIGQIVDEALFRERWRKQMPPEKSQDSFEIIGRPPQRLGVTNNFNMRSDEVNAAEHRLIESEERLASAIDAYLQAHENAQPIPESLTVQIDHLHHETVKSERYVDALRGTGKTLDKPLSLGDAFDRADQSHQPQKDRERD